MLRIFLPATFHLVSHNPKIVILLCFIFTTMHAILHTSYKVLTFQVSILKMFQCERTWVNDPESLWLSPYCSILSSQKDLPSSWLTDFFFFSRLDHSWLDFWLQPFLWHGIASTKANPPYSLVATCMVGYSVTALCFPIGPW